MTKQNESWVNGTFEKESTKILNRKGERIK